MPYLFTCPNCHTKTQVDDQYSGRKGECISCGQPIQIPVFIRPGAMPTQTSSAKPKNALGWVAAGLVFLVICGSAMVAIIRSSSVSVTRLQQKRQQAAAISNLERIAGALNAYASEFGTYPPPVLRSKAGKPLHSWRTLILPFLGENAIYDQIDLTKPWDDQANSFAFYQTPSVYVVTELNQDYSTGCHYYLVTGAGTLFPSGKPSLGPKDAIDGASKTILVIEAAVNPYAGATSWATPDDLDFATMTGNIGGGPNEAGGVQDGGAAAVTVDGTGRFLPNSLSASVFRKLVTPAGGEPLPDDILDFPED